MSGRTRPFLGSLAFFILAPGTVAGWIPYWISGWQLQPAFFGLPTVRVAGATLAALGLVTLVDCFRRFALEGRGTPAPIAPTETLIVSGLYRHVRNPMYVGVLATVSGQALLFGNVGLLAYGAAVWILFQAFVLLYEEPTLARRYGASYDSYRANVHRWWPRVVPWRGGTPWN